MATPNHPCGKPRQSRTADRLMGPPVDVWPVTRAKTMEDLLLHCYPAFGGAFIRRIYQLLDTAIGRRVPLIMAVAGPLTASNQHRAWANPLLETGWFAYFTGTDAMCYHDGHDSLRKFNERPIREVAIEGMDEAYGKAGIIRITDLGFKKEILLDQDEFITTVLRQREFQRKMAGPEFRNLLGKYYDAQERAFGVDSGLLATCYKHGIPVFVGAPGDGSIFLNQMKLWAMAQLRLIEHKFELDIEAEVFESCAYHFWGLTKSQARALAILILGGGVPKNFSLQPEPTLDQILLLENIRGYDFDMQIVGAPVSDGSLTGCKPSEAHTWGKISLEALRSGTESYQGDYSTYMPLIAKALLEKRERFQDMHRRLGSKVLFRRHPEARGYLAEDGHFRLYDRRQELTQNLFEVISRPKTRKRLEATWNYPLEHLKRRLVA